MSNYIIIHGSFGSPEGNWFPWSKDELKRQGKNCCRTKIPVGIEMQNFENWSRKMDGLPINDNTAIIAHSIAPIFVCKYLISNKISVKKLISVCGFNNYLGINEDFDTVNKPMYISNYADIKKYCNNIICFYSDNDPYVRYEFEKEFTDTIANEKIVIKNGGHLNTESGYTEFNEILRYI